METEYKKSQVLEGLDLNVYRDNVVIVGIGTQPILKLSNGKMDEQLDFVWFLAGYGNAAFTINDNIELKDNVILNTFPQWRIIVDNNTETVSNYKDLFVNLSRFDRTQLDNRNKECGRVLIKEYFIIPAYSIIANKNKIKLDDFIETTKSNLGAVIKESGLVIA